MYICLRVLGAITAVTTIVRAGAPSAGNCGATSIAGVPGCWGTPGCAYVITDDLGPGAACDFDYCNCGGTNVQLLPETYSGVTTLGCASWTTQPSADSCPTAVPVVPSLAMTNATSGIVGNITSSRFGASSSLAMNAIITGTSVVPQTSSLPAGETIVTGTVGSQTITETFVLTTISLFASLSSTLTTTTANSQSSIETVVIGPSGIFWTPIGQSPSDVPQLPAPALPSSPNQPRTTPTISSVSASGTGSTTAQSTASDAFENSSLSETTIIVDGTKLHYSKETIASLSTVTAPITVTTPMSETNADGSTFTVSAAIIVVGPGGTWWNGGTGGLGIQGPSCIWPFCPPGGGGDSGGGGSGIDPKDPNTPGSTEDPSDPTDEDDNNSQSRSQATSTPSTISTITSASTTSVSSTASTTASSAAGQPCSPECTACVADPTKLKIRVPRRGLGDVILRSRVNSMSKRTLRTPDDYGGNVMNFLLSEYAWAEWLDINGANGGPSTGFARSLVNKRYDAAPDIANFNEHVINQMQNGGPDIPGLRQFTAAGAEFDASQKPVWAIVTPRGATANSWRYEPEVNEIKGVLNDLFPGSAPVIIDYEPRSDQTSQSDTASGKILFQFDPFQAIITDPNNPCDVYQQAMFRLWVEDRPLYAWQKYWAANADQLITDFTTYNPLRKRDSDPACQIPSSLVQASTDLGGQDMKSSSAPDPDETHWVTLSGSAEATTTTEHISSATESPSTFSTATLTTTAISSSITVPSITSMPPTTTPPSTSYPMVTYPCSTINNQFGVQCKCGPFAEGQSPAYCPPSTVVAGPSIAS
ncbi:MAG: hypothetical protein HETSPECPRED_004496 [Heterodermia speciosa]|uniref:CBM1 domain-containing protein n=1 Tax=Heterodermia speciosa TaxID=116794 RepID=A0A8H3FI44_9LECA|nr:MAG: hypothetical protein HETSPECPRED_004496 [Heterodermia speciosa]